MMRKINYWLLRLVGIKIDTINIPAEAKKCVLLFAPHTSISDFVVGRMALSAMGVKTVFVMKKEAFWWPLGPILRSLGGIPIDRAHVKRFPAITAEKLKQSDEMALLISPEGTRKLNPVWKKGFYYIAQQAEVPILLGYLDYNTRRGGIAGVFHPTGDYNNDLKEMEKTYYGMRGLHKGQFNLENVQTAL